MGLSGPLISWCAQGFPVDVLHAPLDVCMANMGDSLAQMSSDERKERKGKDRKENRSLGGGSGKPCANLAQSRCETRAGYFGNPSVSLLGIAP